MSRLLGPVVAAVVVAATGLLVAPVAPASADPMSSCAGTAGVVVVVDFAELGGGVTKGCDGTAGHTAATNFTSAGYDLAYSHAPGMNGYVCTVQGKPSDGDCSGTDSYWSLWWADGKGGAWTYATLGVDGLKVPAGGYVAFAWHQGSGRAAPPGVQPSVRKASSPTPTAHPTRSTPSAHSTPHTHHTAVPMAGASTSAAPTASATTTSTAMSTSASAATSSATAASGKHRTPTATPSSLPSSATSSATPSIDQITAGPPEDASDQAGTSWGTWLAIVAGVVVIGAAAAVPLLRRRRAG